MTPMNPMMLLLSVAWMNSPMAHATHAPLTHSVRTSGVAFVSLWRHRTSLGSSSTTLQPLGLWPSSFSSSFSSSSSSSTSISRPPSFPQHHFHHSQQSRHFHLRRSTAIHRAHNEDEIAIEPKNTALDESTSEPINDSIDQIEPIHSIDSIEIESKLKQLDQTLILPTISVPSDQVHYLISHPDSPIKSFLASDLKNAKGMEGVKIKLVRDDENDNNRKLILLKQPMDAIHDNHTSTSRFDIQPATPLQIHLPHTSLPFQSILTHLLPPEAHPPPSSYEQVGHIAHLNLKEKHWPWKYLIAEVMLRCHQPRQSKPAKPSKQTHPSSGIQTVVNKVGQVTGPYRTYQMELLATTRNTNNTPNHDLYDVNLTEHGIKLKFNLQNVYWNTRLEGERTYMIQHEFHNLKQGDVVADAFCGVGALLLRTMKDSMKMSGNKGIRILGNDLNPDAIRYCLQSAKLNGIDAQDVTDDDFTNHPFQIQCGDARDFIMNLPTALGTTPKHLILNYPLDSPSFLNALRWWPSGDVVRDPEKWTRVHLYMFARGDGDKEYEDDSSDGSDVEHDSGGADINNTDGANGNDHDTNLQIKRTPTQVAIDTVANSLLPQGGYTPITKLRGPYLNELGCNVTAREIRDAAPGKVVVCVSFSVSTLLLRRMQGDYGPL